MTQAAVTEPHTLEVAIEALRRSRTLAVMAHVNPDADAIGSVLGLTLGLRRLGKNVTPVLSDPVPEYARFLHGTGDIQSELPEGDLDLVVCLDTAGIERVGRIYLNHPEHFRARTILNVDHHPTNPLFGAVNYVDGGASSTSEIVFRLLHQLGAQVDTDAANAMLFGVVGDTGSFQNGATTPGSLRTTAHLLELGADPQLIAFHLFEAKRFVAARLWGRIVSSIELDRERGIVFAWLSRSMLEEEGAAMDETEGVAEYLRGIVEAEVVMMLKENADGSIRVSMRSRPGIDVSAVATSLGGGGHRQAAGCTIAGPQEDGRATLVAAFDRLNPR